MITQEELWQGYDESGEPTVAVTKLECRHGALHGVAHIWFWRVKGGVIQVLFQRRGADIITWPLYLDATVGGHIDLGESPIETALREAQEELGEDLLREDLKLLFVNRTADGMGHNGIIENEFQWVYGYQVGHNQVFGSNDSEVHSLEWYDERSLIKLSKGELDEKLVLSSFHYFDSLVSSIKNLELIRQNK